MLSSFDLQKGKNEGNLKAQSVFLVEESFQLSLILIPSPFPSILLPISQRSKSSLKDTLRDSVEVGKGGERDEAEFQQVKATAGEGEERGQKKDQTQWESPLLNRHGLNRLESERLTAL